MTTAIVTGAARGIGAAIASRLAEDGMAVALVDVAEDGCARTAAKIAATGASAIAVPADVTDAGQVEAAVERIASELGPPTVLVNNAGVIRDGSLTELTDEDWDVVLSVNLRACFLMCSAVRPFQVERGWGRIVNLSSASAMGNRDQANYSAAKAGVLGFTRSLAVELGPHGITSNAVAPGYIVSDMTAAMAKRLGADFEQFQKMVAEQTPVRRVGQPADVAHAVSFLASEGAGFVTGEVIYVTGGVIR